MPINLTQYYNETSKKNRLRHYNFDIGRLIKPYGASGIYLPSLQYLQ